MTRFNHAYEIAFDIESSTDDGSDITQKQFAIAIIRRVATLLESGSLFEAIGEPYDSYEVLDEDQEPFEAQP